MFEVLDKQNAFVGVVNTSAAYRGSICYKQGVNSSGQVLLNLATNSVTGAMAQYPIDKITMRDDLADSAAAINAFAKNERCIFYEGGIFRTNLFVRPWASLNNYSTPGPWPTDSAGYTLKSGAPVYLFPATATGQYGKLKSTSAGLFSAATAPKNRNFEMIAVYNATPEAIVTYKVIPSRIGVNYLNS